MIRLALVLVIAGLVTTPNAARAQDSSAGERVFKRHCLACHSTKPGKDGVGPSLFGVTGNGGPFESLEVLDRYLETPKALVKDTTMPFPGIKNAQDRKDLIAYLQTIQ